MTLKMTKLIKMALTIFLIFFVGGLLLAYADSGQVHKPVMSPLADSLLKAPIVSPFQALLIDSNIKQQPIKEELVKANNDSIAKRNKRSIPIMRRIRQLIHQSQQRDTILLPIYPDSSYKDYLPVTNNIQ